MISATRIVGLFRRRGGSGELTRTTSELTPNQLETIQAGVAGQSPLIASVHSKDEWFAVTQSHLVSKGLDGVRQIPLGDIEALSSDVWDLAQGKRQGGDLKLQLRDGSTVALNAESGGPFMALFNVFRYVVQVNRKSDAAVPSRRPSTDDQRSV